MSTALERYRFTWTLSPLEPVPKKPHDIETPVYPQKLTAEITGIDYDVLRQWSVRGALDRGKLGVRSPDNDRRYFSVLDLLKLGVMAELVIDLGQRIEAASQAPQQIEAWLTRLTDKERRMLERGEVTQHYLGFVVADGELGFVDLSPEDRGAFFIEGNKPKNKPVERPPLILVGWSGIVERVFQQLKELDEREGEIL